MKKVCRDPVGASVLPIWPCSLVCPEYFLRQHPSSSHDLLIWIALHDLIQLFLVQELRNSKLVPLVPLTSRCGIHAILLQFRQEVVQHFLARGSTSEKSVGALLLKTVKDLQHSGPDETS